MSEAHQADAICDVDNGLALPRGNAPHAELPHRLHMHAVSLTSHNSASAHALLVSWGV